jgi:hypothetical protein
MAPMYSPSTPMKKSWTEPMKNRPTTIGAETEAVPVHQLVEQVAQAEAEAEHRHQEADHGREAQRHLRVVGEAEHRDIEQRVEIVLGETARAPGLHERHAGHRVADLGDLPAQVGIGILARTEMLNQDAIIEAEAGEVEQQVDVRQPCHQLVVDLADEEEGGRFRTLVLHGGHGLPALFPKGDELLDGFRRILQVGGEEDHGIPRRLQDAMVGRTDVAEVAGIEDDLELWVGRGRLSQDLGRAVARAVVHDQVIPFILRELPGHGADPPQEFLEVALLVVAAADDRDFFHGFGEVTLLASPGGEAP